jgi:hypothetical protein
MTESFKYRELHVQLAKGITLVVEVRNKDDIKAAISELKEFGVAVSVAEDDEEFVKKEISTPLGDESPEARVELRASLTPGSLRKKSVLAYKDGIPQLLRPGSFQTVSDAALVLIFSVEAGLKKPSVSFDDFKALYDSQNVKSGSPLSMLLNNLKNAGYIDKSQYAKDRTIRLTAKGEKKATDVLSGVSQ